MKKIVILIGGPGCGKGTIASRLCDAHPFNYMETGALFRALPDDSVISQQIARGELVSDKEVCDLIQGKINGDEYILMDGFPRTVPQAQWLIDKYSNDFDIKVIYLNISEDIMAQRIQKRFSEGSNRQDDTDMEIIRKRISNFNTVTRPAIEWLRTCEAAQFADIDAAPAVDEFISEIFDYLRFSNA